MRQISDKSTLALLLLLAMLFCYLVFTILASIISPAINSYVGLTYDAAVLDAAEPFQRQGLRVALLASNLLSFAGTALLAVWLLTRKDWLSFLGFQRFRSPISGLYALFLFFAAIPLVIYVAWLNLQIPLPEAAAEDEALTNMLIGTVLRMDSPSEFAVAFITMAVTPAIGEELLYRGLLQRGILRNLIGNHHLAIWLAAAVFSGAHFELAGFLPRLVLGAVLGYAYYWTASIWMPILLHLLFNGSQVVSTYLTGEYRPDTEMDFVPGWWVGAIGVVLTAAVLWYGEREAAGADAGAMTGQKAG